MKKPLYLRKRMYLSLAMIVVTTVVWLNFRPIKNFLKDSVKDVKAYAEKANPLVTGLALGAIGAADSSFIPMPEGNDILLVCFSIIHPRYMPWFVVTSCLGSLLGSLILFGMGRKGGEILLQKRFSPERVKKIRAWFLKYDIWAILIPCVIPPPMPFKLFVLTAGVMGFSYRRFTLATVIGRIIRYGVWGVLAVLFRQPVVNFMQHYLWEVGLGILVLITSVLCARYIFLRFRRRKPKGKDPAAVEISSPEVIQ